MNVIRLTDEELWEVYNLLTSNGTVDTTDPENAVAASAINKIGDEVVKSKAKGKLK